MKNKMKNKMKILINEILNIIPSNNNYLYLYY